MLPRVLFLFIYLRYINLMGIYFPFSFFFGNHPSLLLVMISMGPTPFFSSRNQQVIQGPRRDSHRTFAGTTRKLKLFLAMVTYVVGYEVVTAGGGENLPENELNTEESRNVRGKGAQSSVCLDTWLQPYWNSKLHLDISIIRTNKSPYA